jgi:hypothetical protein
MINYLKESMLKGGYILEKDLELVTITDDSSEAANIIIYKAQEQGYLPAVNYK